MNKTDSTALNVEVTPVPAATIILVRDSDQGPEIFMVLRHQQIDFASGALVFPGGKVEEGDQDLRLKEHINSTFDDDSQIAFYCAAIRETFEESGILLARDSDDQPINVDRLRTLAPYRKKLVENELGLSDFLEKEKLIADTASLIPYSHWITPTIMPKRFDTRFFLVKVPEGQIGRHDGSESVDSLWITPEQAMLDYEQNKRTIIFPTRMNLSKLLGFASVNDLIDQVKTAKTQTILPWIEERKEGQFLCIPKDAGYEISEISIEQLMRDGG